MRTALAPLVACGLLALQAAGAMAAEAPPPHYAAIGRIGGPPLSGWDYASVDAESGLLYLAADPVTVLDLRRGRVAASWSAGTHVHTVLAIGHGVVALTEAGTNAVLFADAGSGRILARVATGGEPSKAGWHNPDAMVLEPRTGLLVAANGDSGTLVLIDPVTRALVGHIAIGGRLEFAAADGGGRVFVNLPDENAIAVIDVASRAVLGHVRLPGCEEPSGIAYAAAARLVISVCGNGLAKVIDAQSLAEIASLPVAHGADAVMLDPVRHMAFIAGAEDGRLTLLHIAGPRRVTVAQTLDTEPGIRLGAVDPRTGRLYLPTIQVDPKAPPLLLPGLPPLPHPIPATFAFLVVGPAP